MVHFAPHLDSLWHLHTQDDVTINLMQMLWPDGTIKASFSGYSEHTHIQIAYPLRNTFPMDMARK